MMHQQHPHGGLSMPTPSDTSAMMLLQHVPLMNMHDRTPDGLINLRALHGDDTINSEVTFPTGRDAKYFLQDYCFNQNKSMKLRVGKNSGNSKTFVCTSPNCEWRVIATKSKRKNEAACFYFSTIHNIHTSGCLSTRKPSERQHMLLTSSQGMAAAAAAGNVFAHDDGGNPLKKPRRENPVDKIVKTLVEQDVDRQKLSIKSIQDVFSESHGYPISAHAATRAKQVYMGMPHDAVAQAAMPRAMMHTKAAPQPAPAPPTMQEVHQQFQDMQVLVEQNKMVEAAFARAASVGDISAIRTFLRNGRSDLVDSNGSVALLAATKGQFLNVVDCLLTHGAKTEAIDESGATALFLAVQMGHLHIAKCLLDHGARVDTTDEDDNTALMVATRNGRTDVVEFLLKKGANRMAQNLDGHSATALASTLHSYEMAQLYSSGDCHV
ncbi:Aste57867_18 [Aphanomyces stellatus]|uniref:Aste57867_18 protein n=1 Tax=Aphanomyces stellatus TaxID=120398 RepID=A0A485K1Z2_9STRA|nr:hypothetical protein As57867_000018 [Aphanomyces stellatus]VFT77244.1 Aste57867_18 [Aphanomyces stellatus]